MKTKKEIEERLKDLNEAITLGDKGIISFPYRRKFKALREIEILLWVLDRGQPVKLEGDRRG